MNDVAPTLPTACGSLPPEGAVAPAARQSRFRGPSLPQTIPVNSSTWQGDGLSAGSPYTLPTACNTLPPEGAAAPAARQSRFRGPSLFQAIPVNSSMRQGDGLLAELQTTRLIKYAS
jgi:hypothetical protein